MGVSLSYPYATCESRDTVDDPSERGIGYLFG